jgi:hypothetical protein
LESDEVPQQVAVETPDASIRVGYHDKLACAFSKLDMGNINTVLRCVSFSRTLLKRLLAFRKKRTGIKRTGDLLEFLIALLQHCWDHLDFYTAEEICELLYEDCPLLRFMFPLPDQDKSMPPQHIHVIFTYFSLPTADWPSLGSLEEFHFLQLPPLWPISGLVRLLPKRDSCAMTALVRQIIASTKPNAQLDPTTEDIAELTRLTSTEVDRPQQPEEYERAFFLIRHPATPYLWLAVYLAHGNNAAARALLEGGIVDNIRRLYELGFPDPRISDEQLTVGVGWHGVYDLVRLCYMLLRVLGRSAKGRHRQFQPHYPKKRLQQSYVYTHALEEAESLGQFIHEDLRCYGRILSARYHDGEILYRDELEADIRDHLYLQLNQARAV